jgi:hypothetical protein
VDAAADPTPGTDPARRAELRELAAAVTRAVADLPDRERAAFELCYLEGLGRSETIAKLGLTPLQFDRRIRKAKDRLQRALGKAGLTLPAALTATAVGGFEAPAGLLAETAARAFDGRLMPLDQVGLPPLAMTLARAALAGGWPRPLGWAVVAAAVLSAGAAVVAETATPQARPPDDGRLTQPVVSAEREPLRAKNERVMRDQLVPRIQAALQELAPADNPVRLVAIRSRGSEVEAEFRYEKRLAYEPREGGYRFRYCVFRREVFATTNLTGSGTWDPIPAGERLSWVKLCFPIGGRTFDLSVGVEQWARIKAILNEMPTDDRAEREHLDHLFGAPSPDLQLPAGFDSLATNHRDLFVMFRRHVYARRAGRDRWRYCGRGPGGLLAADDTWLYGLNGETVWSRPIDRPNESWRPVCNTPRVKGKLLAGRCFAVESGRLTYSPMGSDGTEVWVRPLGAPTAEWSFRCLIPDAHSAIIVGDRLYGLLSSGLASRPLGDPRAEWRMEALTKPKNVFEIVRIGGMICAYSDDSADGPIYGRPLAGAANSQWQVVGWMRDPEREVVEAAGP